MAPSADTPAPPVSYAPQIQSDDVLAGREFELPMVGGPYAKLVDPSMPLMLQNTMGSDEYKDQVEEINQLLEESSRPYVNFITRFRTFYITTMIALMVFFFVCFILAFFTAGISIIVLFVVWVPAVPALIIGTFYSRFAIKEKKRQGDEKSRVGLSEINEKWRQRGIAWRQKEGSPVFVNTTGTRRRMAWLTINPLVIIIELAPNAATLFRTMGPFPSSAPSNDDIVIDMQSTTPDSALLNGESAQEMQFMPNYAAPVHTAGQAAGDPSYAPQIPQIPMQHMPYGAPQADAPDQPPAYTADAPYNV
mmetsp:Transcript_1335/g.4809  ORF Transcript_1335/g.4809 Transcript_1335/m.4809 type:complete len:306 (-) Transcript_1335:55-972(-)|eukprot:CAMPEP_0114615616 /NCGR_PEP_ID=MMETSP0168-20121206/6255_1 /TAXON_ID=95228 ORGANISM="Vannella sp., Strain DIVA3 517/6/12" /NCGR_SAMPLE_ID=MMETSP0168 /ASSEMBLY_ACC=CAM_ASM_000044 /LENGTH=305 /DNA_ID=CAMNT_0001826689 /DNA_START=97 /DNA_END=1014 /DNA_ORIENTATION=+